MPPPHPTPNHKSFQFAPPFLDKFEQFTPNLTPNTTNHDPDFSGLNKVQTRTKSGRTATRFEMAATPTSTPGTAPQPRHPPPNYPPPTKEDIKRVSKPGGPNSPVAPGPERPALQADVLKEKLHKVRAERQNREDKQPSLLAQRPQCSPGKGMMLAKAA